METAQLHAIVHGYVQGVSFRWHTRHRARILGLTGWVRNRPDGTVEVVAEGPRNALEELLAFLRVGPSLAHVERVDVEWLPATGAYHSFEVRF